MWSVLILFGLFSLPALAAADVTDERATETYDKPQNWFMTGRDGNQSYFSPLTLINKDNVARLGYAWSASLGTFRGAEATPIVIDGVMYTSGYYGIVYALDAATGKQLWRYDPKIDEQTMRDPCCDTVNRGVAVWRARVYVASIDGKLHAIDAATGHEIWTTDTIVDHNYHYSSTGAPQIAHDTVVIGNSGGDGDRGGVRGYVSGYDLVTGALKWRVFTVPPARGVKPETTDLSKAEATWDADRDPSAQGGGTVWDGITYDPVVNLVFVGTGNPAPYGPKIGDGLFTCSILAIDPDTGRLAWHYQTTPGDRWDFDSTQKMIVADLKIDGKARQVVMQAAKNGFFYVLDRRTGALISAKNYTFVNWAKEIDAKTGRPVLTPQADYSTQPRNVYPSWAGGHTWPPMSFDQRTGLVYIPVNDIPVVWLNLANADGEIKYMNGGFGVAGFFPDDDYNPALLRGLFGQLPDLKSLQSERPGKNLLREFIRAWDPVAQRTVWEHETSSGLHAYNGGIISTAGNLVFQGRADGKLYVYAADTGAVLQTIQTGGHIMAAPTTYAVGDTQYVAVQTGFGGTHIGVGPFPATSVARIYDNENRVIAFRLDGGTVPMPPLRTDVKFPAPPMEQATAEEIHRGEKLFLEQCGRCHVFGPSITPDLSKLPPEIHEIFADIVLRGAFATEGMESFGDILKEEDVRMIHAYLIDQQRRGYAEQEKRGRP